MILVVLFCGCFFFVLNVDVVVYATSKVDLRLLVVEEEFLMGGVVVVV